MSDSPTSFNAPLDPQSKMDAGDDYSERGKRAQSDIDEARTLADVLAAYRGFAGEPAERGRLFERLIKRYLQTDPTYKAQFEKVWLWDEWPDRPGPDTGVDLVARYHPDVKEGGLCAIQCKFYEPGNQVPGGDVANFILTAQEIGAKGRIFVTTTDNIRQTDHKRFNNPNEPTTLLGISDLERSAVRWPDIAQPEKLEVNINRYDLRPDQREAIDACIAGFENENRGKLILPCGVGKTFTALKLAEEMVGIGGTVLYLVPSIALLGQAMREWSRQAGIQHRYIGVCSDVQSGKQSEDASVSELHIPVTTDVGSIGRSLSVESPTKMTVVFSTYQSIERISEAQRNFWPRDFNLILCDEAHRTTGVERSASTNGVSPFTMVHGNDHVHAKKRLYMTATPRIYSDAAKTKAINLGDVALYSMDDEEMYGQEFHRMSFASAVEAGLLSDYRVLVLNIDEAAVAAPLQRAIAVGAAKELPLEDAAKLVGCASALFNPTATVEGADDPALLRAIAFSTTIRASKAITDSWEPLVNEATNELPEESRSRRMKCKVEHVDGTMNALIRSRQLDWLRESEHDVEEVRVLSNARCLSEGVDVPALDAVLFMQPRRSQVDVVQAVGRVMRRAEGKKFGYVILPIVIPADEDAATALDNNKRYEVVWEVLQALRSHDERLDAEINQIDLNSAQSNRIQIVGVGNESTNTAESGLAEVPATFQYKLDGLVVDHFYARVVERVGDRQYWDKWATDVAKIATTVQTRLRVTIPDVGESSSADGAALRQRFDALLTAMRATTNDALTEDGAIAIVSQHMITGPVFNALYPDYDFTKSNPVARSLNEFVQSMGEHGLESEMQGLEKFYDSVRRRSEGIDNPNGRRRVLEELYENFFKAALPKEAQRLGVVYTPHELVDFILHSVNDVLKQEFGKSLADPGVHILDPFAGMGTFIWRLIANSDLIPDDALHRKYTEELHANEILPLAYYMATINIEEAYRERVANMAASTNGSTPEYEPFRGIVWRDTFNAPTDGGKATGSQARMQFMQANDERARRQDETEITVIVGNPPWRAQQKTDTEGNPNVDYPSLERRVAETYARHSIQTNKNGLYNTYKLGIRWGTDRLSHDRGILGFVTSAKFTTSNVDSGIRRSFLDDFTEVSCVNLRGAVKEGEGEGENIFGDATTEPVASLMLTKADQPQCRVRYAEIDEHMNRPRKLEWLLEVIEGQRSVQWTDIEPQDGHIWINRNDESFSGLRGMASKSGDDAGHLFGEYSVCPKTGKDKLLHGFGIDAVHERMRDTLDQYARDLVELRAQRTEDAADFDLYMILRKWHIDIARLLERDVDLDCTGELIERVEYRPFVGMFLYREPRLIQREYRIRRLFPSSGPSNPSIVMPTLGISKPFSVLGVDAVPDGNLMQGSKAFPLNTYETESRTSTSKLDESDTVQARRDPAPRPRAATPRRDPAPGRNSDESQSRAGARTANLAICVAGVGATKPFSSLITDIVPDLELVTKGQCFPRFAYERIDDRVAGGSRTGHTVGDRYDD